MARGWMALLALAALSCGGSDRSDNAIEGASRSAQAVAEQARQQLAASRVLAASAGTQRTLADKQILFGDLHVHTTYSPDAFTLALPIMGGEGAHTLSDPQSRH